MVVMVEDERFLLSFVACPQHCYGSVASGVLGGVGCRDDRMDTPGFASFCFFIGP
jgi:hypothetical protein